MDAVMAGDEEVEAVARDANPAYDAATHDETREHWRRQAKKYIEALDRVRSRPAGSTAGGTEGEDHEAGIEMATQVIFGPPTSASARQLVGEAIAAYRECVPSPVSGTEPDTASELERLRGECCVCEKCGHVQAEPNWCHKCRHRTTMPDWAKPLVDAFHEREADPPEPDTAKPNTVPVDDVARWLRAEGLPSVAATFLAGFSVDVGKPEEER